MTIFNLQVNKSRLNNHLARKSSDSHFDRSLNCVTDASVTMTSLVRCIKCFDPRFLWTANERVSLSFIYILFDLELVFFIAQGFLNAHGDRCAHFVIYFRKFHNFFYELWDEQDVIHTNAHVRCSASKPLGYHNPKIRGFLDFSQDCSLFL